LKQKSKDQVFPALIDMQSMEINRAKDDKRKQE
jgi:hypothetical protein